MDIKEIGALVLLERRNKEYYGANYVANELFDICCEILSTEIHFPEELKKKFIETLNFSNDCMNDGYKVFYEKQSSLLN